jgi:exopolysaccharide biosynthesis polyprenyl glycosylphosphotransferase
VILALLEALAIFGTAAGTAFLWQALPADWLSLGAVIAQATVLCLCCIVAFYYNDLYDVRIVRSFSEFVPRLLKSLGATLILLAGVYALFPAARIPAVPLLWTLLIILGLLLLRILDYSVMRAGVFTERVLILGTGALARTLIEEIHARPQLGYQIVGVAHDGQAADDAPSGYPPLPSNEPLDKIAEAVRADRIIVAMSERRGRLPMLQLLALEARGIAVEDGVQTYEHFTRKLAIETLTPSLLVFSPEFRKSVLQLALQRVMSLAVAAVGLVLTAPIMALTALAIKLDSRGPVLFVQDRAGLHGRPFRLLKFRTMVPPERATSEWARDNEARITRVGHWLRKFRLDELPQFVNILRGDMNLVGPRPHPISNSALFGEYIPYYILRASVRPGVTGWAQVRYGYANNLEEEFEKMRYDLYYIKHGSLWFDLRILADTLKIILSGRGSEAVQAVEPEAIVSGATSSVGARARSSLRETSRA